MKTRKSRLNGAKMIKICTLRSEREKLSSIMKFFDYFLWFNMNYIKKLLYEYELYIVCLFKILILSLLYELDREPFCICSKNKGVFLAGESGVVVTSWQLRKVS